MVKIFVAQTQERDRSPLCDFLKAAELDVHPYETDANARLFLITEMYLSAKPYVLVTSQRDKIDCDYMANILHTVALASPPKTLTVVYSRAVAHQAHMYGIAAVMAKMEPTQRHGLRFVPKFSETSRAQEHAQILQHIHEFLGPTNKP